MLRNAVGCNGVLCHVTRCFSFHPLVGCSNSRCLSWGKRARLEQRCLVLVDNHPVICQDCAAPSLPDFPSGSVRCNSLSLAERSDFCLGVTGCRGVGDWEPGVGVGRELSDFVRPGLCTFGSTRLVVVAFSSRARIFGDCLTSHSPPALFFFFLKYRKKWRFGRAH